MSIILKINRHGTFKIAPEQDTMSQCGREAIREYGYHVTIEATDKKLTPEGFVMDNFLIFDYFRRVYVENKSPCLSCEKMALDCLDYFQGLFKIDPKLKEIDVRRIYVKIQGTDVSFIEAEWCKPILPDYQE